MRTFVLNLFSGETSAGKSSMLNLILGKELLPFSVLSTTSTICELKYGKAKEIKVHFKQEGKEPEIKQLDELSPYIDQISTFVGVTSERLRESVPKYKKVELFWDHELLKVNNLSTYFSTNIYKTLITNQVRSQPTDL